MRDPVDKEAYRRALEVKAGYAKPKNLPRKFTRGTSPLARSSYVGSFRRYPILDTEGLPDSEMTPEYFQTMAGLDNLALADRNLNDFRRRLVNANRIVRQSMEGY